MLNRFLPMYVSMRTLGMAIAMTISWMKWHSLLWIFIHGFFGWGYVIYFFIMREAGFI
jgi:hypothetical protein